MLLGVITYCNDVHYVGKEIPILRHHLAAQSDRTEQDRTGQGRTIQHGMNSCSCCLLCKGHISCTSLQTYTLYSVSLGILPRRSTPFLPLIPLTLAFTLALTFALTLTLALAPAWCTLFKNHREHFICLLSCHNLYNCAVGLCRLSSL
jgi:hypothetical protein